MRGQHIIMIMLVRACYDRDLIFAWLHSVKLYLYTKVDGVRGVLKSSVRSAELASGIHC